MLRFSVMRICFITISLLILLVLFSLPQLITPASASGGPGVPTVTIYVQTFDSCQHAMGGGSFWLTGNGQSQLSALAPGAGVHVLFPKTQCPVQRGNCTVTQVGCVTFIVPKPWWGQTVTYTIVPSQAAPKAVLCNGGSDCVHGPATATVNVSWSSVSATVRNIAPDGFVQVFPTGGTFAGTAADPIVVHEFMLGTGSCDGDHDLDDRLTGSPSGHCDSERDRK